VNHPVECNVLEGGSAPVLGWFRQKLVIPIVGPVYRWASQLWNQHQTKWIRTKIQIKKPSYFGSWSFSWGSDIKSRFSLPTDTAQYEVHILYGPGYVTPCVFNLTEENSVCYVWIFHRYMNNRNILKISGSFLMMTSPSLTDDDVTSFLRWAEYRLRAMFVVVPLWLLAWFILRETVHPPKHRWNFTSLHGVTSHKLIIIPFIIRSTEYVVPKGAVFGSQLDNGSWTGAVGMVVRKDADVGISFFAYLLDRMYAVDFLPPIWKVKWENIWFFCFTS
jgi:hypothetical protein